MAAKPATSPMIDIGIAEAERRRIAEGLSRLLADTFTLYLTTHNFHWNVKGPMFQTLPLMFQEQYNELWLAVDEVAERMRAMGFMAPGTTRQLSAVTSVEEEDGVPKAEEMIRLLVEGHEAAERSVREAFKLADEVRDQPTCDLMTRRMIVHEKAAWMLRSMLE